MSAAAPGTWLLTGGAGYIGAHVARALRTAGYSVVLLDDLSTGSLNRVGDLHLVKASVLDSPEATAARMWVAMAVRAMLLAPSHPST